MIPYKLATLVPVWMCVCGVDSLEVIYAPLHLLILGECYVVHINASSL